MLLIGLDAASRWENFGFAIGRLIDGQVQVEDAGMLSTKGTRNALLGRIVPKLQEVERALIAIDAPLGWPISLQSELVKHRAGEPIGTCKDKLFKRETDRVVAEVVGKMPLEVGADKIARAAHTGLEVLACLRGQVNSEIPLAWAPRFEGRAAIEVYPGATLKVRGIPDSGYKKQDQANVRRAIARSLRDDIAGLENLVEVRADQFDACLCLLAAKDFLEGTTIQVTDDKIAHREGWIWVRAPKR